MALMEERTTGIILRTRPLTESSLIVQWLTRDFGRISTVAKGARRPKSSFTGKLDLFFEHELSFVRSRRSELHTLREVALIDSHPLLRQDLGWLQQASYAVALIENLTETGTPLPEYYALLQAFIAFLPSAPPQPCSIFALEARMLRDSGFEPDWDGGGLTPGAHRFLHPLLNDAWANLAVLKPTSSQLNELNRFFLQALSQCLDRLPRGRAAALGMTAEPFPS